MSDMSKKKKPAPEVVSEPEAAPVAPEAEAEPIEAPAGPVDTSAGPTQAPAEQGKPKKRSKKGFFRNIHNFDASNDIRYSGPLSYIGLRALAWVFLCMVAVGWIITLWMNTNGSQDQTLRSVAERLTTAGSMMMPLFLIANYSIVLQARTQYWKTILRFLGMAVLIAAIFYFVVEHYAVGLLTAYGEVTSARAREMVAEFFYVVISDGLLGFNVFIDLLLCVLFAFFVNYRPKRVFTGKKIYIFRAMAALPLLYDVAGIAIKGMHAFGLTIINMYIFPWLPVKPPMTFIVFVLIVLFLKHRERIFAKANKTIEEYEAFLGTKLNSFHVSLIIFLLCLVGGVIDLIAYFIATIGTTVAIGGGEAEEPLVLFVASGIVKMGIGGSFTLIFVAPIMLLFSYSKDPKYKQIGTFLPFAGIGVFAFILLEGAFQIFTHLPK